MNINSLAAKATALAASQKEHLGRPTIPPIDWHQEGEILTVVMADGRKVTANIRDVDALLFPPQAKPVEKSVEKPEKSVDKSEKASAKSAKSVDKPQKPQTPQKPQKPHSETKPK